LCGSNTGGTVSVAGAVTLYLFLVPAGALILLVTLVSLLQLYQPKLLPGMVQPSILKERSVFFFIPNYTPSQWIIMNWL
jgi:hypothetical protein